MEPSSALGMLHQSFGHVMMAPDPVKKEWATAATHMASVAFPASVNTAPAPQPAVQPVQVLEDDDDDYANESSHLASPLPTAAQAATAAASPTDPTHRGLKLKPCHKCGAEVTAKNMARHMALKHSADPFAARAPASPSSPAAAPTPIAPVAAVLSAPATPPAKRTMAPGTPVASPPSTVNRRYSETLPRVDSANPLIAAYVTSLQARGKTPSQAGQDVTKVCKILHLMGTMDRMSPVAIEADPAQLLTSPARLDTAIVYLKQTMGRKTVVNWLQTLAMFVRYVLNTSTVAQRPTLATAIPPFLQHVNDLRASVQKQAAAVAVREHSVETYRQQNRWLEWDAFASLMEQQLAVALDTLEKLSNHDPVTGPQLHHLTMTCALLADLDCTAKRGGEDPKLLACEVAPALEQSPSYIDNPDFKTSATYGVKSYVLTDRVRDLWRKYGTIARPLLLSRRPSGSEKSPYWFLTNKGSQLTSYSHDTTLYFQQATGDRTLQVNHTVLRKMETTAADARGTAAEFNAMRVNRAHSDPTARSHYLKKAAHDTAEQAARAREAVFGTPAASGLGPARAQRGAAGGASERSERSAASRDPGTPPPEDADADADEHDGQYGDLAGGFDPDDDDEMDDNADEPPSSPPHCSPAAQRRPSFPEFSDPSDDDEPDC